MDRTIVEMRPDDYPERIRKVRNELFPDKIQFGLEICRFRDYEALAENRMYAYQNSGAARRCLDTASLGMDGELIRILKKHPVKTIISSDAYCPENAGYKIWERNDCIQNCQTF